MKTIKVFLIILIAWIVMIIVAGRCFAHDTSVACANKTNCTPVIITYRCAVPRIVIQPQLTLHISTNVAVYNTLQAASVSTNYTNTINYNAEVIGLDVNKEYTATLMYSGGTVLAEKVLHPLKTNAIAVTATCHYLFLPNVEK